MPIKGRKRGKAERPRYVDNAKIIEAAGNQKEHRKASANSSDGEEEQVNRGHRVENGSANRLWRKPAAEDAQGWLESEIKRSTKQWRREQPRRRGMKSGQAEVLEKLSRSVVELHHDLGRRNRHWFGTIEPFAASNPWDDQRELERRSQHIGNLQDRLVQTQRNASRDTAQRGCPKKRVDRNHAANRERQREARRRGALRELPRDRRNDATFPPRRCRWDLVNCVHANVGSGDQIDAERSGDERGWKCQPTGVAPCNDLGEL